MVTTVIENEPNPVPRALARKSLASSSARELATHVPYQSYGQKIKILRLEDIDGRTKEGKRLKATVREREAAMGGNLSDQQFQDLVTLVVYEAIREHMNVMKVQGDPAFDLAWYHTVNKDIRLLRQGL